MKLPFRLFHLVEKPRCHPPDSIYRAEFWLIKLDNDIPLQSPKISSEKLDLNHQKHPHIWLLPGANIVFKHAAIVTNNTR